MQLIIDGDTGSPREIAEANDMMAPKDLDLSLVVE